MPRISCLAGLQSDETALFGPVLKAAGFPGLALVAHLNVSELGKIKPALLVCGIDALEIDALEFLRQVRFVLEGSTIVVYTKTMKSSWSVACHLAGANGLLLKDSTPAQLTVGVRSAVRSGCFTDPRFAAA